MLLDKYQQQAMATAVYPRENALPYLVTLLASEACEVSGKYGKFLRGDGVLDVEGIIKEMGDTLWALALLAHELNWDLSDVARVNLEKLRDRQARGVIKGSGDNR